MCECCTDRDKGIAPRSGLSSISGRLAFVLLALLTVAAAPQDIHPDIHYVPTSNAVIDAMFKLAAVTADDVVYDLGSGDGRIVIAAARKLGARGVGVELDPALVKKAN